MPNRRVKKNVQPAKVQAKRQRPRRQKQGNSTPRSVALPTAVANSTRQNLTANSQRIVGKELLYNKSPIEGETPLTAGDYIYNKMITPRVPKRLGHLAKAYQRIIWRHVRFELVPLNGSNTSAGYVAGFAEDPSLDVPSKSESIDAVSILRGATAAQSWVKSMTGNVLAENKRPQMYTYKGLDTSIREFALGRLLVVATGNVGADANFQVWMHYDAELLVPMDPKPEDGPTPPDPPVGPGAYFVIPGTYAPASQGQITYDGTIYRLTHPAIGIEKELTGSGTTTLTLLKPLLVTTGRAIEFADGPVFGKGQHVWILPVGKSITMKFVDLSSEETTYKVVSLTFVDDNGPQTAYFAAGHEDMTDMSVSWRYEVDGDPAQSQYVYVTEVV